MAKPKKYNRDETSKTVGFVALGCPKNMVDSEAMLARIGMAGYILTPNPDNADIVIINTCGFIAPACEEAFAAIRKAVRLKKKGRIGKVIVAGCLSQRLGEELNHEIEGIDAIVGLAGRDRIEQVLRDIESEDNAPAAHLYLGPTASSAPDDRIRLRITPQHWAYLRISEGCNRRCSFCTIPSIRGKYHSKPMETLLDEARMLADNGAVELSLIAQDSNYYGRDIGMTDGLVHLLRELEKIPSLHWIRLMYLYPAGIDAALIETIAGSSKIVHYVDMPIQHINDNILKSMHRTHTRQSTTRLLEQLRNAIPDIVLRTTVIAGFPGETQAQFDELLDFIKWAKFDALGCFPFYPESGTPAARLSGQLPEDIRRQRSDQIMQAQQAIAFARGHQRIGSRLTVLADEKAKSSVIGRFYGQAPHIDSVCIIENSSVVPGTFIEAEVIGQEEYDLVVRRIKKQKGH
ncbi:MAG: 30S ribosomal protein S12 methylthiotransferase RimO [Sedimentisphaerales bacterium]|nr:30S ribosomal protein S12 methylthiotransferase RimO [Sedimentisphaerales bacterium]